LGSDFRDLVRSAPSRLEALLRASKGLAPETLAGFEWRGYNLGPAPRLLGIQKFVKGFYREGGGVGGYNIPVIQNGLDADWISLPAPGTPKRYAFYRVTRVEAGLYPGALLLDYGVGRPSAGLPSIARLLRDYVVVPDPSNPRLLLGKAYFALGPVRLPSNFFVLERLRATAWQPDD
jgi:hypothetical protein